MELQLAGHAPVGACSLVRKASTARALRTVKLREERESLKVSSSERKKRDSALTAAAASEKAHGTQLRESVLCTRFIHSFASCEHACVCVFVCG